MPGELRFIDEFDALIEASPPLVFETTARTMGRSFEGRAGRAVSATLGCVHRGSSYTLPPQEGQEANGFRVASVRSPTQLVLEGRHRFAIYRLSFFIDPLAPRRCRLRARTDALFPGFSGAFYRALVIGTGGHEVVVRRLLAGVAKRAENTETRR